MELNRIYNVDCLEGMKKIEDDSISCILTDPPYNTTHCGWECEIDLNILWNEWKRIIKPNGVILIFGSEPFSSKVRLSNID